MASSGQLYSRVVPTASGAGVASDAFELHDVASDAMGR